MNLSRDSLGEEQKCDGKVQPDCIQQHKTPLLTASDITFQMEAEVTRDVNPEEGLPDHRGWGWVVVFGTFFNYVLVLGYIKSSGLFFVEMLDKFKATATETALLFGVRAAVYALGGFLVMNVLLGRYGSRKLILIGGLFLSLSAILSSLANGLALLICTQSIFLALGHAMLISPGQVLVGHYFSGRRRSLALSISELGVSVGNILVPPLMTALLTRYALQGALLLYGGVCLHSLPAALLHWPIKHFPTTRRHAHAEEYHDDDDDDSGFGRKGGSGCDEEKVSLDFLEEANKENDEGFTFMGDGTEVCIVGSGGTVSCRIGGPRQASDNVNMVSVSSENNALDSQEKRASNSGTSNERQSDKNSVSSDSGRISALDSPENRASNSDKSNELHNDTYSVSSDSDRNSALDSQENRASNSDTNSASDIGQTKAPDSGQNSASDSDQTSDPCKIEDSGRNVGHVHRADTGSGRTPDKPMGHPLSPQRVDSARHPLLDRASKVSQDQKENKLDAHALTIRLNVTDSNNAHGAQTTRSSQVTSAAETDHSSDGQRRQVPSGSLNEAAPRRCGTCPQSCISGIQWSLFRSPLVCLFMLFTALMGLVMVPPDYLPALVMSHDVSEAEAALLLSLMGGLDLLCRVACCVIAGSGKVRASTLTMLSCFGLAGLYLFVGLMTTFPHFVVLAVGHGLLGSVGNCLFPLLVIEFVGVDQMAACVGFSQLVGGASMAAIYPLLGYIRDRTGSYVAVYYVISAGLLLVAILMCFEGPVRRLETRRRNQKSKSP